MEALAAYRIFAFVDFLNLTIMAKTTYSDKLKDPRWQKKRLEIMERDNFTCRLCGDKETTLNVHHTEYSKGEPWEINNDTLFTLCEHCHLEVEHLKKSDDIKVKSHDINSGKFLIYKSIGWEDKTRIMFISYYWKKSFRIINVDNEIITAFNLSDEDELKLIAKILTINLLT